MRIETVGVIAAVAVVGLVGATDVTAGVEPSPWRPASLLTNNLVMHGGRPFIALSELARALGGTGRYDAAHRRYEIQPGSGGVLSANPGLLSALGLGGEPDRSKGKPSAYQNAFELSIGGRDVGMKEEDGVMMRPADPAVSLNLIARLLGGTARFDAGKGSWVLPPGGPGTPLRFR